jgi:hypothetical protein
VSGERTATFSPIVSGGQGSKKQCIQKPGRQFVFSAPMPIFPRRSLTLPGNYVNIKLYDMLVFIWYRIIAEVIR